jgi:hypothetical protein
MGGKPVAEGGEVKTAGLQAGASSLHTLAEAYKEVRRRVSPARRHAIHTAPCTRLRAPTCCSCALLI